MLSYCASLPWDFLDHLQVPEKRPLGSLSHMRAFQEKKKKGARYECAEIQLRCVQMRGGVQWCVKIECVLHQPVCEPLCPCKEL